MLHNFTNEYKQAMLDAENQAKKLGHKYIIPKDILGHIIKNATGNLHELFENSGINEDLIFDILSRPPFSDQDNHDRDGDYVGVSERLRMIIVESVRVAAKFGKTQAGTQDFLLAMISSHEEKWFRELLDFIGITPSFFEKNLTEINQKEAKNS